MYGIWLQQTETCKTFHAGGQNFVNACHASLFKASNSSCSDLCPEHIRDCFYNDEVTNPVAFLVFLIGAQLAAYILIMYIPGRLPG